MEYSRTNQDQRTPKDVRNHLGPLVVFSGFYVSLSLNLGQLLNVVSRATREAVVCGEDQGIP